MKFIVRMMTLANYTLYKVQGIYDIIVRVSSDTEEKLKELISERIRRIDRITGTVTVIIAKEMEERKQ
jgi:DNA-binding Lrp family transcriptional regulator